MQLYRGHGKRVQVPQYRPEVTGGWLRSIVLRIITPECHRVIMYIERLLNACRCNRGKIPLSQPPGEFYNGPRASTVIDIMV